MPNPSATPTPITPPRVPFIDPRTGLIDRAWYMFFLSLYNAANDAVDNPDLGSNAESLIASYDEALRTVAQAAGTTPFSASGELQQQIDALRQEVQTQRQPELGSMAPLEQDNVPWLTFNNAPSPVPTAVGSMYWDGGTTMNVQMTANVLGRINEAEYVYAKASAAITKGQLCYHTGAVGSSGTITAAPTPIGLADPNQIVGVAAEDIALNGFGLIQVSGDLRGFNTTGASVGETWADGDPLYYNPAYVGSMTKVKPSAPNQKSYIGEVINAGSGGSGSMHIRITPGSVLGGTDSNVQFNLLANNDLIQYDSAVGYWKNVPASTLPVGTATNLAGGLAGSVPYQSAPGTTTFLNIGATGRWLGSSGTAPQWNAPAALTRTNDTNVTLTLGGSASTALLNAASLTLGWTGTLAATRGGTGFGLYAVGDILYADTTTTLAKLPDVATGNALISGGVGVAPAWGKIGLTTHVTGTLPVGNGGTGTATAFTAGSVVFAGASGIYSQDNANFFWDDTNNRLGIGNATPACAVDVTGGIQTSRTDVTSPAATDGNIFSGIYTPTQVSTNANVDSVTFSTCQYMRVGNVVTVGGQIAIDATTAATDTTVRMSLPIASAFTATAQLGGTGSSLTTPFADNNLAILADTTNDCVLIRLRPTVNTSLSYSFSFTYRIV